MTASVPPPADAAMLVLDEQALDTLRRLDSSGGNALLLKVMSTFLGAEQKLRAQAEAGLARGDWLAVREAAHTLKSSAAYIGAVELSRLSMQIERCVRDGGDPQAQALIEPWLHEMARAREAAQALVQGGAR